MLKTTLKEFVYKSVNFQLNANHSPIHDILHILETEDFKISLKVKTVKEVHSFACRWQQISW